MESKEKLVHPTFAEAFRFWVKLGFISFGGPSGQIAIMHTELVEKRRWIAEDRFLNALNFCMLLPGPEAQQLATYIGWLLHRTWGGIVAGAFFVLPSMFILWALSLVYVRFGTVSWIASIFYILKAAVLAIVLSAVLRIGKKALRNHVMWGIAALAFVAIFFLKLPFPLIIAGAALIGYWGGKLAPHYFNIQQGHSSKSPPTVLEEGKPHPSPGWKRAFKIISVCLLLWWLPLLFIFFWLGPAHTIFQEGLFFSKAAMVTFGGAYAVLPYVSQQAVENFGWLSATQMMDGLGLAETTPGPLIMVLQFVGFVGAYQHPMGLPPLVAATLGAFITTWTTFLPCFLWIFVGAPHIEQLQRKPKINNALSAVTASVVGVILNLAVWFGLHLLFPERKLDWFALLVAVVVFAGMTRWRWNIMAVVAGSGLLGLIHYFLKAS
ncbi:MAG: chromate efflux transporter [Verrucomicrobiota bacterium]|nr:chromate efflux transporter [Verrucomicrobiota bacterium]